MLDRIKIVCRGVGRNGHRSVRYLTAFSLYSSGNPSPRNPHRSLLSIVPPSSTKSTHLLYTPRLAQHKNRNPIKATRQPAASAVPSKKLKKLPSQPIIPAAAALLCSQRCTTCRSHPVRSTLPWKRLMAAARREKQSKVVRVCVV
jgi:hypothetical protein